MVAYRILAYCAHRHVHRCGVKQRHYEKNTLKQNKSHENIDLNSKKLVLFIEFVDPFCVL